MSAGMRIFYPLICPRWAQILGYGRLHFNFVVSTLRYVSCTSLPAPPAMRLVRAACAPFPHAVSAVSIQSFRVAGDSSYHCQPPSGHPRALAAAAARLAARTQRCRATSFSRLGAPTNTAKSATSIRRIGRALQAAEVSAPPKVRFLPGAPARRRILEPMPPPAVRGSFHQAAGSPCALAAPTLCTEGAQQQGNRRATSVRLARRPTHRFPAVPCSCCLRAQKVPQPSSLFLHQPANPRL